MTVLFGCGPSRFPDVETSFSAEVRNADWPGFLPVSMVLSSDVADIERVQKEVSTLRARVLRLRYRARLLQAPVAEAQEKLRQQYGVTQ